MNLTEFAKKLYNEKLSAFNSTVETSEKRCPVHVVYGGADRFSAQTPKKFGKTALDSLEIYAPNFVEFAKALWLKGSDTLPDYDDVVKDLEFRLFEDAEKVKSENFHAWFAWTIYNRTIEKLKSEPIEDFRIDFEDGFGIRLDAEEDASALNASDELAISFHEKSITPFCGFRIKSFQSETFNRSTKTLDLFLSNLLKKTGGVLPQNFVVTLPKIKNVAELEVLDQILLLFEKNNNLAPNSVKIEIMIETPEAVLSLEKLAKTAKERCASAHFGAYDYTSSFGVTAVHQHLNHPACDFARQMMQVHLSPLNIRLSDSVTTEMPIPLHRQNNLSETQKKENRHAVHKAWRLHFNNVTNSQINGFYQSWDLHPNQLTPRYASVYSFFLESFETQAVRLKNFLDKATKATLSGNQFDDAASAQGLLNFFARGLSCGALTINEVTQNTGLTIPELRSNSFTEIMNNRLSGSN